MKVRNNTISRTVRAFIKYRTVVLLLLGGSLLGIGCAGGGQYSADETRIARTYLPSRCDIPSHPDSLSAVTIVEKKNKLDLQLDRSYEKLMRDWSSTWLSQSTQRQYGTRLTYKSFATMWSLDLSIASLITEQGVEGLSKDLAWERINQRKKEHQQTLQIDLFQFVGSPPTGEGISGTLVGRPGSRVTLQDDQGNEYRPAQVQNGPPVEAIVAGQRAIYRRNTFFFRRQVQGRDILEGVQSLRLYVSQSAGARYYFTWSFEDVRDAVSSP